MLFATASRENKKAIKIWKGTSDPTKIGEPDSELPSGSTPCATSLQFFPSHLLGPKKAYGMVVGLEQGQMSIWVQTTKKEWQLTFTFDDFLTHGLTVRRIKFGKHKESNGDEQGKYTLASCGNDHTVRIY